MDHFHVCDESAVPCDDPEDRMVVAIAVKRRPTCYGNLSATKLKDIIVFYYILPRAEGDAGVLYRPPTTYLG
jgi:hypothetical protein